MVTGHDSHEANAKPCCPRHHDSHVVFDGSYGKLGHRRPLYPCYPGGRGGRREPFHRFTEPLPREAPAGRPIAGGIVAFNVLAAVAYDDRRATLWSMQSSPTANARDWTGFFSGLDGQPDRVVCDAHGGITAAVLACWPAADIYFCEWHLADKMRLRLRRAGMHLPSEPAVACAGRSRRRLRLREPVPLGAPQGQGLPGARALPRAAGLD